MMIMRMAALFVVFILAGCSILPQSEPKDLYIIPPASVSLADALASQHETAALSRLSERSLRIRTPHTDKLTNSQRILVRPDSGHLQAYKGASWGDTPPRMIRDYLVQALRSHTEVAQIVSDEAGVEADLMLESDLSVFRVDYVNEQPMARIQLDALLMNPSTRGIVAGKRFALSQEVQGKELPEVVTAFGQAMEKLTAELVAWLEELASTLDG